MEEEELSSDSSDEDYVPTENVGLSEEEDSGDEEDLPVEADADDTKKSAHKSKTRTSKTENKTFSRKRKGGIQLEEEKCLPTADTPTATAAGEGEDIEASKELARQTEQEQEEKKVIEEKNKADRLWADFMKDVPSVSRPKTAASLSTGSVSEISTSNNTPSTTKSTSSAGADKKPDKVTIVKEFKFAGETVRMSETVDANSRQAKQQEQNSRLGPSTTSTTSTATSGSLSGLKRPGGLSSVLGKIDKRPKMSTLVKSQLDWDSFKSTEGINDELKIHNRGKDGYLERQAFLNRTDHRQFEIEKNLRLGSARK